MKWTKKELAALKKTWPNGTSYEVETTVNEADITMPYRCWQAIKKQASRMKLRKSAKYRKNVLHRMK